MFLRVEVVVIDVEENGAMWSGYSCASLALDFNNGSWCVRGWRNMFRIWEEGARMDKRGREGR